MKLKVQDRSGGKESSCFLSFDGMGFCGERADMPLFFGPCIYYLIQNLSEVVYVGQSVQGVARIVGHLKEKKKKFDQFGYIEHSPESLTEKETEAIMKHQPIYNKRLPFVPKGITSSSSMLSLLLKMGHERNRFSRQEALCLMEASGAVASFCGVDYYDEKKCRGAGKLIHQMKDRFRKEKGETLNITGRDLKRWFDKGEPGEFLEWVESTGIDV